MTNSKLLSRYDVFFISEFMSHYNNTELKYNLMSYVKKIKHIECKLNWILFKEHDNHCLVINSADNILVDHLLFEEENIHISKFLESAKHVDIIKLITPLSSSIPFTPKSYNKLSAIIYNYKHLI